MIFLSFTSLVFCSLVFMCFLLCFQSFLYSRLSCRNATKLTPIAFGTCHMNGLTIISIWFSSVKFTGITLSILSAYAFFLFPLSILNCIFLKKHSRGQIWFQSHGRSLGSPRPSFSHEYRSTAWVIAFLISLPDSLCTHLIILHMEVLIMN